jgi:hypothetical protein
MTSPINTAYSFEDVVCSISGPGGEFSLSNGGVANEGITLNINARVTTLYGADGEWMHSLHAAKGGRVVIRVMRNGRVNAQLSALFSFDTSSSANCGQNTISLTDIQRGDDWTAIGCACEKLPDQTYATEGGIIEWVFHAGEVSGVLGNGQSSTAGISG